MLERGEEERLGLEGYPPELSIYLSVLSVSGLHHQEGRIWVFGPARGPVRQSHDRGRPITQLGLTEDDPGRVGPMWQAIDLFLTATEEEARPVTALYELLACPPFGIKEGLLPIYFTVALLHWKSELALYEEGTFVPQPGVPELERLLRAPERFSVRRYRLHEARFRMLYAYSTLLGGEMDPGNTSVLTAVRPLIAFAKQLSQYTLLTRSLNPEAIALREALITASEPQLLLFNQLPAAIGFDHLGPEDTKRVPEYIDQLKRPLLELQGAYGRLLEGILAHLGDALLLPSGLADARREVGRRARVIRDWVADPQLKPFVMRLADTSLPDREWLESVAAVLVHKPPNKWNDSDVGQFRVSLQELAGRFRRTEEAALETTGRQATGGEERIMRLGVTDSAGQEQRQMLRIRPADEPGLSEMVNRLEETLRAGTRERRLRLLALAELARRLMGSEEEDDHCD